MNSVAPDCLEDNTSQSIALASQSISKAMKKNGKRMCDLQANPQPGQWNLFNNNPTTHLYQS